MATRSEMQMRRTISHQEIARPDAVKSAPRRALPRLKVVPNRIEEPQEAAVSLSVEVGRVVQSPKYGRGYIAKIEDETIRVRFWKYGYKAFRAPEAGYPFDLIDEVRALSTPAEKLEGYCEHRENRHFCCKCAGLSDQEIEQWKPYRSNERPIIRRAGSNRYIGVRISRNDCVLTSRPQNKVPNAPCPEEAPIVKGLYFDPNSRFQEGGTGFLRIPLDEPRSTRADAPKWLDRREEFFKTLKLSRAARAEQIFSGFYLADKTDSQIAETLGWRKNSVKKERAVLIRKGNRFFTAPGDQIPP